MVEYGCYRIIYRVLSPGACDEWTCALACANRDFGTDKHHPYQNHGYGKNNNGVGLSLDKIADCARMCFSSVRNRRSARTGRRPRKLERRSSSYPDTSAEVSARCRRAAIARSRAPTVFSVRIKSVSVQKTRFWIKAITEGAIWVVAHD